VAFIIWIAFTASIFLYGLFVYICETQFKEPLMPEGTIDKEIFNTLIIVMVIAVFFSLYGIFFVKTFLEKPEKIIAQIKRGGQSGPDSICGALRISMIIHMACIESIVISGLFLYLINSNPMFFIYFSVPALLLMFQANPSVEAWSEKVQEVLKLEPEVKI